MSAETAAAPPRSVPARDATTGTLRPGWITIAGKELADHLLSVRFYVLLFVLGIAALIPLYFAGEVIRSLAPAASGQPAIFLAMFVVDPAGQTTGIVTAQKFVAMAAPLLGIAFSFDAVNGERHQGTLPRLLSQPIHRDDVINGKFAAGVIVIALVLTAIVAIISGFGMLRLGITPEVSEILRVIAWIVITTLYVGLWLAFGMLLSVVIRRAATSALIGFGVWLFVAIPFFGPLLVGLLGRFMAAGSSTQVEYASTVQLFQRLLPGQLYAEASVAILSPGVTTLGASEIYSQQAAQQMPSTVLSLEQSLLLIWPHLVILFALMIGCFALAYARFMRQEVRA